MLPFRATLLAVVRRGPLQEPLRLSDLVCDSQDDGEWISSVTRTSLSP